MLLHHDTSRCSSFGQVVAKIFIAAFVAHFRSRYPTVDGALRPEELARAEELVAEKFGNPEWTARVP